MKAEENVHLVQYREGYYISLRASDWPDIVGAIEHVAKEAYRFGKEDRTNEIKALLDSDDWSHKASLLSRQSK